MTQRIAKRGLLAAAAVTGTLVLGLTACGSTADRQAEAAPASAPATTAASGAPTATAATAGPSATASSDTASSDTPVGTHVGRSLGTMVCILNNTKGNLTVDFTAFDTREHGADIPPAGRVCAEGTYMTAPDVAGTIATAMGSTVRFSAFNPAIGRPRLSLVDDERNGFCSSFAEDESDTYDDSVSRFVATRNADSGWKEFTIDVRSGSRATTTRCEQRVPGRRL